MLEIINKLADANVYLYVDDGKLKTRAVKKGINQELADIIKENKSALIDYLVNSDLNPDMDKKSIPKIMPANSKDERLVLSHAQERLWFIDQLEGASSQYNIPITMPIKANFNIALAEKVFNLIVERHTVLRTVIKSSDSGPFPVIINNAEFKLNYVDLRYIEALRKEQKVNELILEAQSEEFDLSKDLMIRGNYFHLSDEGSKSSGIVVLVIHHIAADGWSMDILAKEFNLIYAAMSKGIDPELAPLAIQYSDYAAWQRQYLKSGLLDKQLNYWRTQLDLVPVVNSLPLDNERPAVRKNVGASISESLSVEFCRLVINAARRYQVTPFMLIHSAFCILLSRHSNTNDVVVGTVTANRTQPELESLVGFFINTLALRANTSFHRYEDYLSHIRSVNLDAQANQDVPFESVVESLALPRNASHTPLVQIMLSMNTNEKIDFSPASFAESEMVMTNNVATKFDLALDVEVTHRGGRISWEFDSSIYNASRIKKMHTHFRNILDGIISKHSPRLSDLGMLTPAEIKWLSYESNKNYQQFLPHQLVHQQFEEIVDLHQESIALHSHELGKLPYQYSYQALNVKANQIARLLQQNHALRCGDRVAVCMQSGIDLFASIIATLKLGAAYVPIDVKLPINRIKQIIHDASPKVILTFGDSIDLKEHELSVVDINSDVFKYAAEKQNEDNLPSIKELSKDAVCYVIYTSGSTGKPKGVMVSHANVLALVNETDYIKIDNSRVFAQAANMSFDAATFEIWSSLCHGARCAIIEKDILLEPRLLDKALTSANITTLFVTTAMFNQLANSTDVNLGKLTTLLFGGEKANYHSVIRFLSKNVDIELIHVYGPTEATTFSTSLKLNLPYLQNKTSIPIGKSLKSGTAYILTNDKTLAPLGSTGELYLGGIKVAKGYLGQPELTQLSFSHDEFSGEFNEKLYRTGDLVRLLDDGNIEFIGRVDKQVKIRGFRIEPEEIESHLISCKQVNSALVVVSGESQESCFLAGYVVLENEFVNKSEKIVTEIRNELLSCLPEYMIPQVIIAIEDWPLNQNGKVDLNALPDPECSGDQSNYVAPSSETEKSLRLIWSKLLGRKKDLIGLHDDFFLLGGHSLLAIQLVTSIRDEFAKEIQVTTVFNHSKLEELAGAIDRESSKAAKNNISRIKRIRSGMPLSFAQERLWFVDRLQGESPEYNIPFIKNIHSTFNVDAAEEAIKRIIDIHETLRTVFKEGKEGPVQIIKNSYEFTLSRINLSKQNSSAKQRILNKIITNEGAKPFNLSEDIPIRATYINLINADCHDRGVLIFNIHHIAADGWSVNLFEEAFDQQYLSIIEGRPKPQLKLGIQYVDFAVWQRKWLKDKALHTQLNYWKRQLKDIPVVHNLPINGLRKSMQSGNGEMIQQSLSHSFCQQIINASKTFGITTFMFTHAALSLTLARHSGVSDIVVGTPVANRGQSEIQSLIGYFVNMLVLRVNTNFNDLNDFLSHVKQVNIDAQNNQDIPFEYLVDSSGVSRSTKYSPLFQIMLSMNNLVKASSLSQSLKDETIRFKSNTFSKYEIAVSIEISENGGVVSWEYNRSYFNRQTIESLHTHFRRLLTEMVNKPSESLRSLSMLSESDKKYLIKDLNNTALEFNQEVLVHQLFEQHAALNPDKIAIVFESQNISYKELNERAEVLAEIISKKIVYSSEKLIGLCIERSVEMIVSMLAVLKSGCAYVPLDPKYPKQRLQTIITDSNVCTIITTSDIIEGIDLKALVLNGISEEKSTRLINLDTLSFEFNRAECRKSSLAKQNRISNETLYLVYTSGSTGMPKGVCISHKSIVSLLAWGRAYFDRVDRKSVLASTSICFDLSAFEIFLPLTSGDQCVLTKSIIVFSEHKTSEQVTLLNTVPSAATALLDSNRFPKGINTVNLAGEPLRSDLVDRIYRETSVKKVYDLYGPSETTTYSTSGLRRLKGKESIGRPLANTQVYVLDSKGELAPLGSLGELYIGGVGLSQGYFNNPSSTAEKFIPDNFSNIPSSRLYKTGDLVRYSPENEAHSSLEYIGRIDQQVKIRGFRIELEEIDYQLKLCDFVKDALVSVVDNQDVGQQLVAYLVPKHENLTKEYQDKLVKDCKQQIALNLPEYMLPSEYIILDRFPLTPNGKIDKKALPEPQKKEAANKLKTAKTAIEKKLIEIWAGLLGLEEAAIGIDSNFFELGGHSLLVVKLVSEIRREFSQEIKINTVFDYPNIEDLANFMKSDASALSRNKIHPVTRLGDSYPLSFSQERMWFIDRMEGGSYEYNMPFSLPIKDKLCLASAEKSLTQLIERHSILRTVYTESTNGPVQSVLTKFKIKIERIDLHNFSKQIRLKNLREKTKYEQNKPFNLREDLMIRASYLDLGEDNENYQGLLLITLHHIAADGWSLEILINEFKTLYKSNLNGQDVQLPPLEIQYSDYSVWQRNWLSKNTFEKHCEYWETQLKNVPASHSLPLDSPRPEIKMHNGEIVNLPFAGKLSSELIKLAKRLEVTPFMIVHAALTIVLSRHTNNQDVIIGTVVANRLYEEVEPLIGFFVNTLVLRTSTSHDSLIDLVNHIKQKNLEAQEHQELPFEKMVELAKIPRSSRYTPLFQIMLTMNSIETGLSTATISYRNRQPETVKNVVSKFDLSIDVSMSQASGLVSIEYDTSIFKTTTVKMLGTHLLNLLREFTAKPDAKLNQISMLSKTEVEQLVKIGNSKQAPSLASDVLLNFERHAESALDSIASVMEVDSIPHHLSYGEMDNRASNRAQEIFKMPVCSNKLVAIYHIRSFDLLISTLAVLKCGYAFLPIDDGYPNIRINNILKDSSCKLLITENYLMDNVDDELDIQIYDVKVEKKNGRNRHNKDINEELACINRAPFDLAYVIYTSGSTGTPKGVMVENKAIDSHIYFVCEKFSFSKDSRVLQFASFGFDTFFEQTLASLSSGSCLHIRGSELWTANMFFSYCKTRQITITDLSPGYLAELVKDPEAPSFFANTSIQKIVVGGDVLRGSIVKHWLKVNKTSISLYNAYGPTEAVITTTVAKIESENNIIIGKVFSGKKLYILDDDFRLAPLGSVGTLYIGGAAIARGYLGRPKLTAEKFINSPFTQGERLYCTGDIVRYTNDGSLEFIGRVDSQVKIRGYRVELSEVEAQVSRCSDVINCAIVCKETKAGHKSIAAYLVLDNSVMSNKYIIDKIKDELKSQLPSYMLPSSFSAVAEMPQTINGKIDYDKLTAIRDDVSLDGEAILPRNLVEGVLSEIWRNLFNIDSVNITDNFFDLGGNSLLTVKLSSVIKHAFSIIVSINELFNNQSIESQAKVINEKLRSRNVQKDTTIRLGKDSRLAFLVPGLGGSSHVFHEVVKSLDDNVIAVGLDAAGLYDESAGHDSIEDMAKHNLEQINRYGSYSEIVLVGHSMGASVALQMALYLKKAADVKVTLIAIDGTPFLDKVKDSDSSDFTPSHEIKKNISRLINMHRNITYSPSKISDAKTIVIKASENVHDLKSQWQEASNKNIDCYQVDGDHFSILTEKSAMKIANIINESL